MGRNKSVDLFGKGSDIQLRPGLNRKVVKLTPEQFATHVAGLSSALDRAALDYTVAFRRRALVVFDRSFKYNRFYNDGSTQWAPITDGTWRNRLYHMRGIYDITQKKYRTRKKGESKDAYYLNKGNAIGFYKQKTDRNQILREFGFLKRSLSEMSVSTTSPFIQSVYVDRAIAMRNPIHREVAAQYAAWHNSPGPNQHYGKTGVKYKKRQFMGHSSYLVGPGGFIERYEKRYLFDAVFGDMAKK